MMVAYMRKLEERLRDAGFSGRVLVVTLEAGVIDARDAAEAPIQIVNSGPSMAPVAGRYFGSLDEQLEHHRRGHGGTTYDVSLVRKGVHPLTRETWIGQPYSGLMIGFPSVDVQSVGAGGGSIASVDTGGLLHVGPAERRFGPGPSATAGGALEPTVTDASVVLGYIDPDYFLGGAMRLDRAAARRRSMKHVARRSALTFTRCRGRDHRGRHREHGRRRSSTSPSIRGSTRARRCSSVAAAPPVSTPCGSHGGSDAQSW